MACLVTGGTGFIGSYSVRDLLDTGKEVVCFQRSGVTPTFREVLGEDRVAKVKIVQGDLSDTLLLFNVIREHGIDLIVHLGYVMPPTSEQQPAYALRVNCVGMNNLLEAVRLFSLKRLIWVSAGLALGSVFQVYKKPIGDDNAIYRPDMMYGATKALNEFMAKLYYDKFGVDSIGFRLQRTYGVGRWHGAVGPLMEFFRKAALNLPTAIEDTDFALGHLYVEDLSSLIAKASDAPTTRTRVFNVIEGNYTNKDLVRAIRKINPDAQITLESPQRRIVNDYTVAKVDSSGVRAQLGWQPKYSLEDGLRKVLNYFRQKEGVPLL